MTCERVLKKHQKGGESLNLDEAKKMSDIFNNVAQPAATILAVVVAYKLPNKNKKPGNKKQGRRNK